MEISEKESSLSDYTGFLARQWPMLLLGLLLGLALGVGMLAVSPKTYEATTSVLVQPTGDDTNVENGRTNSTINLDTEAQIVTSNVVTERSAELMDSTMEPRGLAKRVSVQVPANTSVLKITFAAATPDAAQDGANSFAEAYLANREQVAEDKLESSVEGLEKTIASLNEDLIKVNEDLVAATTESRRQYLSAQRNVLVQQIRTSTSSLSPLQNQEVQPGAVITRAQRPTTPSGLNPWLVLISSLFVGLLLGLVLGVVRDRRDHRVRSRHDLERLGLDVLVGRFTLPRPDNVLEPRRRHDDPLRQCRNALLARLEGHRGSLVVSAASSSILGATAAASVAVTFARSGVRTVLVGCNTGADITAQAFGVAESPSLTDVLRSNVRADEAMHRVPASDNLAVVPPGPDGSLYSELLQEASMRPTLEEFESLAEVVVVDAATTAYNADAQSVVTATQGLLLVVTANVTSTEEVIEAIDQMEHVDAVVLGALLVDPGRKASRSVKKSQKKAARQAQADHGNTADDANLHQGRKIGASADG